MVSHAQSSSAGACEPEILTILIKTDYPRIP